MASHTAPPTVIHAGCSSILSPTALVAPGRAMRAAPPMAASQPKMVMSTRQSATHRLWASTMATPATMVRTPER